MSSKKRKKDSATTPAKEEDDLKKADAVITAMKQTISALELKLATASTTVKRAEIILQCPVNQEPMLAPVMLPCGHVFEFAEIKKWLADHSTCPLCRRVVEKKSDELTISLMHVSLREALFQDQKVDWKAVQFPTGSGSNHSQFLKLVPAAAAAAAAAVSAAAPAVPLTSQVIRLAVSERRREMAAKVKTAEVWALSFYKEVVLPCIDVYIKNNSAPGSGRWECQLKIPISADVDTAQSEALSKILQFNFNCLWTSNIVQTVASYMYIRVDL